MGTTRRRFQHPCFGVAVLAAALLAAGCSRLSGEHDADVGDAQSARVEQLLDDAPDSLKAKKKSSQSADEDAFGSANVVADTGGIAAGGAAKGIAAESRVANVAKSDGAFDRPSVGSTTSRPKRPTPSVRPRPGKTPTPRSNVDEIPDAAEVGL
ncbi:MAG: hypothetical protein WD875_02265 [Pirellulales bacterium]